jgi:AraC-like DNA-binding protein
MPCRGFIASSRVIDANGRIAIMQNAVSSTGPAAYCARTTDVGKRHRIDYWTEAFGSLWGDVDLFEAGAGGFYGALRSVRISSLRVNRISFKGMGFRRSNHQLQKLEVPFYSLAFPVKGQSIVSIDASPVELQPDRIFLLDNSIPAQLVAPDVYETLNIQIPVNLIRERLKPDFRKSTMQLASGSPAANMLHHFVRSLYGSDTALDERSAHFLEQQICDMVAFCFSGAAGARSEDGTLIAAQRERASRCIERLYSHERLSPQMIAAACGVSVSYLHKFYKGTGRTVMEHVSDVRLDAADHLLRRGGARATTISQIAYSVGFKSLSDFSRAYKRRFGRSPLQSRN